MHFPMEGSLILSLLLLSLAIAACAVSIALDNWYLATVQSTKGETYLLQYGLWHRCSNITNPCPTWTEYLESKHETVAPVWLTITQVTMLAAGGAQVLSLILMTVYGFIVKHQVFLVLVAIIFAYVGGVSVLVGISVFGVLHEQWLEMSGLYIAFGVGTGSACLVFIATFFMFVLWRDRTIDVGS